MRRLGCHANPLLWYKVDLLFALCCHNRCPPRDTLSCDNLCFGDAERAHWHLILIVFIPSCLHSRQWITSSQFHSCIILLSQQGRGIKVPCEWHGEKGCLFTSTSARGDGEGLCYRQASIVNYLKGAVHKSFVQVDDDTVLAVVCYADLWQEELGWWLQRQRALLKSWDLLEGTVPKHAHTLVHTLMLKVWWWPSKSAGDGQMQFLSKLLL